MFSPTMCCFGLFINRSSWTPAKTHFCGVYDSKFLPFARILPSIRLFPGPIVGDFAVFIRFWKHLSRGTPSLVKEQAIEIID